MSEANNRRFAISTLSKSRIVDAYNGELLGDKYTGEIMFKTPDGDGISFMANTRKTYNVDKLISVMNNHGYTDFNIYEANSIEMLPAIISPEEIITVPLDESSKHKFTAYSISLDIDCFEKNTGGITSTNLDALLLIGIRIYTDGVAEPHTKTIHCNVSELKSKVFSIESVADNIAITISPTAPDGHINEDCRFILHSVLIATNNIIE